ncbi:hypothetical protein N3K66_004454 [Trichothecium roseum]|uniref:Uncharacterized protein n=1 Tax=Trichothecium roseum TaxID=47278 RepID=A0ACC0V1U7_9HYPO|nr:hypothetical protein N3K66_004454 [Trichothecium roseum]
MIECVQSAYTYSVVLRAACYMPTFLQHHHPKRQGHIPSRKAGSSTPQDKECGSKPRRCVRDTLASDSYTSTH